MNITCVIREIEDCHTILSEGTSFITVDAVKRMIRYNDKREGADADNGILLHLRGSHNEICS